MASLVYESLVNDAALRTIDDGIRGDLQQPSRERDRSRSFKLASALQNTSEVKSSAVARARPQLFNGLGTNLAQAESRLPTELQ